MKFLSIVMLSAWVLVLFQTLPPPPTGLAAWEITGQADLGAQLSWSPVPGATYNVYRAGDFKCAGTPNFVEIASGLRTTSYTDQPSAELPLGFYCYGVEAVVDGIESAKAIVPLGIGNKSYWTLQYRQADCKTASTQSTFGTKFVLVQTLYNVTTTLINQTSKSTTATSNFVGFVRLYDNASYSAWFTLPDGKDINVPVAYSVGIPLSAISSSQFTIILSPTDAYCSRLEQDTIQPATSNPHR